MLLIFVDFCYFFSTESTQANLPRSAGFYVTANTSAAGFRGRYTHERRLFHNTATVCIHFCFNFEYKCAYPVELMWFVVIILPTAMSTIYSTMSLRTHCSARPAPVWRRPVRRVAASAAPPARPWKNAAKSRCPIRKGMYISTVTSTATLLIVRDVSQ